MLKNYQEMLEYGFEVLNRTYFNGALPPVVITIQDARRGVLGYFTVNKEWVVGQERMHEICISSRYLRRNVIEIMSTLQHELVHLYCSEVLHIQETSQFGRYHNKHFKEVAEQHGIKISYAKYIGWSVTEPTPEFIQVLKDNGIEKPDMYMNKEGWFISGDDGLGKGGLDGKDGANGVDGVEVKKPKCSTRKYQCPCCQASFRATRDINVLCIDCNEQFVKVEKGV